MSGNKEDTPVPAPQRDLFDSVLLRAVSDLACERGRVTERVQTAASFALRTIQNADDVPEPYREPWTRLTEILERDLNSDPEHQEDRAAEAAALIFSLFLLTQAERAPATERRK